VVSTYNWGTGEKRRLTPGPVTTYQPNGKDLVSLSSTTGGGGLTRTFAPNGKEVITLGANESGEGTVTTHQSNGKKLVRLSSIPICVAKGRSK
jgi:hypothetical protein